MRFLLRLHELEITTGIRSHCAWLFSRRCVKPMVIPPNTADVRCQSNILLDAFCTSYCTTISAAVWRLIYALLDSIIRMQELSWSIRVLQSCMCCGYTNSATHCSCHLTYCYRMCRFPACSSCFCFCCLFLDTWSRTRADGQYNKHVVNIAARGRLLSTATRGTCASSA